MNRAAIAAALALAAVALGACARREPIATCADDLGGTWRSEAGERWMILDSGPSLEIYTLFDDTHPTGAPAGSELAPRVIDLNREVQSGDVKRRYLKGADSCIAKAPVHLLACRDDTIELVLADPAPPVVFTPCSWGRPRPSRRERWRRE